MKKAARLLAFAGIAMIGIQSCKKEEKPKPPVLQSYDVQLKANEAYTFTLPKNKRNDPYEITSQSNHYTISAVGEDASGNRIYQYTPAKDYAGTDRVVIANPKEEHPDHGKCGPKPPMIHPKHPHGDCDKDEEDHYIVTINFTINKDNQY